MGEGAVWVANVEDETVSRIDPATRERGRTIDVGDYPSDVVVARGTVWVALGALAELTRIDPAQDQAATPIPALGPGVSCGAPRGEPRGGRRSGVVRVPGRDLGRIDIRTGTARRVGLEAGLLTSPNAVLPEFSDIAFGLGSLWIVNRAANVVTEVDTATIQRQRDITVGNSPTAIAVSPPDSLWVANFEDDTVTRIVIPGRGQTPDAHADPRRGRARRRHVRRRQRLGRLEPRPDADPDRPRVGRGDRDDRARERAAAGRRRRRRRLGDRPRCADGERRRKMAEHRHVSRDRGVMRRWVVAVLALAAIAAAPAAGTSAADPAARGHRRRRAPPGADMPESARRWMCEQHLLLDNREGPRTVLHHRTGLHAEAGSRLAGSVHDEGAVHAHVRDSPRSTLERRGTGQCSGLRLHTSRDPQAPAGHRRRPPEQFSRCAPSARRPSGSSSDPVSPNGAPSSLSSFRGTRSRARISRRSGRDRMDNPKTGVPIGNGPFLVERWERGKQLTLRRNPRYWGQHVAYLDRLVVRFCQACQAPPPAEVLEALRRGSVDFALSREADIAPELRRIPGVRVRPDALVGMGAPQHPGRPGRTPGAEEQARTPRARLRHRSGRRSYERCGARSIGRTGRARARCSSTRLAGTGRTGPQYRYRPLLARRLLEQAGCRRGPDGIYDCAGSRLSLRLLTFAGVTWRERDVRVIQAQLRQIGVEALPTFVTGAAINQIFRSGDYDLVSFAWFSAGNPLGKGVYGCGGPQNYSGYCQRLVTSDLDQADRILDADRRATRPQSRRPADGEGRAGDSALPDTVRARVQEHPSERRRCALQPLLERGELVARALARSGGRRLAPRRLGRGRLRRADAEARRHRRHASAPSCPASIPSPLHRRRRRPGSDPGSRGCIRGWSRSRRAAEPRLRALRSTRKPFTLTYHIRPEARWSDGVPVTASDFLFTHQKYATIETPAIRRREELYGKVRRASRPRREDVSGRASRAVRRLAGPVSRSCYRATPSRTGLDEGLDRPDRQPARRARRSGAAPSSSGVSSAASS